jgi:hypothetical protein
MILLRLSRFVLKFFRKDPTLFIHSAVANPCWLRHSATSSHGLSSGDVLIGGKLEVDSQVYSEGEE